MGAFVGDVTASRHLRVSAVGWEKGEGWWRREKKEAETRRDVMH